MQQQLSHTTDTTVPAWTAYAPFKHKEIVGHCARHTDGTYGIVIDIEGDLKPIITRPNRQKLHAAIAQLQTN